MDKFEEKLRNYIESNNISAEHLVFKESCHSVKEAALAVNASPKDLVKNICLIDNEGGLVVAIVKGENWASLSRIGMVIEKDPPRLASPDEVLEKTGYICGGVPSFGYKALFLIDSRVMMKDIVYSGGGSENSLVKIATSELLRANQGQVVKIRE